MPKQAPVSDLVYLKRELGFTSKEWLALNKLSQETLKEFARQEMRAKGIPIKGEVS